MRAAPAPPTLASGATPRGGRPRLPPNPLAPTWRRGRWFGRAAAFTGAGWSLERPAAPPNPERQ
jgi:hypothetical protein